MNGKLIKKFILGNKRIAFAIFLISIALVSIPFLAFFYENILIIISPLSIIASSVFYLIKKSFNFYFEVSKHEAEISKHKAETDLAKTKKKEAEERAKQEKMKREEAEKKAKELEDKKLGLQFFKKKISSYAEEKFNEKPKKTMEIIEASKETLIKDIERGNLLVANVDNEAKAQASIGVALELGSKPRLALGERENHTLTYFIAYILNSDDPATIKELNNQIKSDEKQPIDKKFLEILSKLYSKNYYLHFLIPELSFIASKYGGTPVPDEDKNDFLEFLGYLSKDMFLPLCEDRTPRRKIPDENIEYKGKCGSVFVGTSIPGAKPRLYDLSIEGYIQLIKGFKLSEPPIERVLLIARGVKDIIKGKKVIENLKKEKIIRTEEKDYLVEKDIEIKGKSAKCLIHVFSI